jgi:hypothetical protein
MVVEAPVVIEAPVAVEAVPSKPVDEAKAEEPDFHAVLVAVLTDPAVEAAFPEILKSAMEALCEETTLRAAQQSQEQSMAHAFKVLSIALDHPALVAHPEHAILVGLLPKVVPHLAQLVHTLNPMMVHLLLKVQIDSNKILALLPYLFREQQQNVNLDVGQLDLASAGLAMPEVSGLLNSVFGASATLRTLSSTAATLPAPRTLSAANPPPPPPPPLPPCPPRLHRCTPTSAAISAMCSPWWARATSAR